MFVQYQSILSLVYHPAMHKALRDPGHLTSVTVLGLVFL